MFCAHNLEVLCLQVSAMPMPPPPPPPHPSSTHPSVQTLREEASEISCMVHSDEVDFLVTGNDDGTIRLWNADSGSTITLTGHQNTVTCLATARRGRVDLLLSAGFDGHVGVWDISKRRYCMPRLYQTRGDGVA